VPAPDREAPSALDHSVDDLPAARFGGYDRDAVKQLLDEAAAAYSRLHRDHLALETQLEELRRERDDIVRVRDDERSAVAEHAQASARLLEDAERDQEQLAAQLKELGAEVRAERERGLARESELDAVRRELESYKRRELVVSEMIAASRQVAERVRNEARIEATKMLRKARRREETILRSARAELREQEQERERMRESAQELRTALSSILVNTLQRLDVDAEHSAGAGASPSD
jgi:cell division septum initiation protein DivIVA